jgi:transcriptional regulator with XRE-family HTH domain
MFSMNQEELRAFLATTGLSVADLAKLVDVTPRGVAMWLSGERAIPGPVAAYVRIFSGLPDGARYGELQRLLDSEAKMRDGMYAVQYRSGEGAGFASVILDSGRVFGADPFGGKYDGYYAYDAATGLATVKLKVAFPPGAPAVFAQAQPFEWSVDIVGVIDPRLDRGHVVFDTPLGRKIEAQYQFLRDLPVGAVA